MPWAVHWLNAVLAVFRRRGKHMLSIVFPMPGFFPQYTVHHERPFNFLILVLFELHAHKSFQLTEDSPAIIMPEHHTGCFFLHVVKVQLLTNLTMVAFGRFFQTLQISIQLLFITPSRAVNTLQHFIFAVATPIGPRCFLQFKVMAETHIRHMRATAHINVFFMVI
ncbi:Uncharacterised protein [Yersinia enterocolitica]|nr:Uncharacterised protein [Yersinia enterocolitica]